MPSGGKIAGLDPHDLAAFKFAAVRTGENTLKDIPWLVEAIACGLIDQTVLSSRVQAMNPGEIVEVKSKIDGLRAKIAALKAELKNRGISLSPELEEIPEFFQRIIKKDCDS